MLKSCFSSGWDYVFSPSVVYISGIDVDLDTDKSYSLMLFNNTMAYFRTAGMTLRRLGTGGCSLLLMGRALSPLNIQT